jgi:hypothetical protein
MQKFKEASNTVKLGRKSIIMINVSPMVVELGSFASKLD